MNSQIAASWQERNGGEHVMSHEDKQGLPSTSSNPPVSGEFPVDCCMGFVGKLVSPWRLSDVQTKGCA